MLYDPYTTVLCIPKIKKKSFLNVLRETLPEIANMNLLKPRIYICNCNIVYSFSLRAEPNALFHIVAVRKCMFCFHPYMPVTKFGGIF